MDRRIVYPTQLPRALDMLTLGRQAMVGLAKLSETVLGTSTYADGFGCLPTSPASNTVIISGGTVYQQTQLESSSVSVLAPDPHAIVKQGVALDPITLTLSPPATVGFAVNVLIQVQYSDYDDDAVALQYYNSGDPKNPYTGPNNTGVSQPQTRKGTVQVQPKYGIPTTSGSQQTPTPDAGWVGLFVITIAYGQTAITSGGIIPYVGAPTVPAKLPTLPRDIQQKKWTYFADTSATPNLITGTPLQALDAYATSTELDVLIGNTNTGPVQVNISNLGLRNLTRRDGSPLIAGDIIRNTVVKIQDDGTQFRLSSLAQGEVARIVTNPVFYVRTDGSDTNDGSANTASKAFGTIAGAILNGANKLTTAGRVATIILGNIGTFPAPTFPGIYPNADASLSTGGTLLIQGNGIANGDYTATTQSQYIIEGVGAANMSGIVHVSFGTQLILRGVKIQNDNVVGAYHTLAVTTNAAVYAEFVTFGGSGVSTGAHVFAADSGAVKLGTGCIIQSSAGRAFFAQGGSITLQNNTTLTVQGNLTFTEFARAEAGQLSFRTGPTITVTGTVTGTRYVALNNGVINTTGSGANYFPGTVAGSFSNGGIYV